MRFIFTLLVIIVLALGGMIALAHHDTVARLDAAYGKFAPATASLSRFRSDKEHLMSIYWRLHFAKKPPGRDIFAFWSLKPFRHVTVVVK